MIDQIPGTKIYTVNFLFTPNLQEVWMVYKKKGPFPDRWNGVGGKFEDRDRVSSSPLTCMRQSAWREIKEETGVECSNLHWIVTETFPRGHCPPWGDKDPIELWVFCGIVDRDEPKQMEDEPMKWVSTLGVLDEYVNGMIYAGSGNIPYFIYLSLLCLREAIR